MQTFLPVPNLAESVACLDDKRLGKQRVEGQQILDIVEGRQTRAWQNHPVVRMWRGHVFMLKTYINLCIDEWIMRGFNNNMKHHDLSNIPFDGIPLWYGDTRLHDSHKSNLKRKSYYYFQFDWDVPVNLPYYWPVP